MNVLLVDGAPAVYISILAFVEPVRDAFVVEAVVAWQDGKHFAIRRLLLADDKLVSTAVAILFCCMFVSFWWCVIS